MIKTTESYSQIHTIHVVIMRDEKVVCVKIIHNGHRATQTVILKLIIRDHQDKTACSVFCVQRKTFQEFPVATKYIPL